MSPNPPNAQQQQKNQPDPRAQNKNPQEYGQQAKPGSTPQGKPGFEQGNKQQPASNRFQDEEDEEAGKPAQRNR